MLALPMVQEARQFSHQTLMDRSSLSRHLVLGPGSILGFALTLLVHPPLSHLKFKMSTHICSYISQWSSCSRFFFLLFSPALHRTTPSRGVAWFLVTDPIVFSFVGFCFLVYFAVSTHSGLSLLVGCLAVDSCGFLVSSSLFGWFCFLESHQPFRRAPPRHVLVVAWLRILCFVVCCGFVDTFARRFNALPCSCFNTLPCSWLWFHV